MKRSKEFRLGGTALYSNPSNQGSPSSHTRLLQWSYRRRRHPTPARIRLEKTPPHHTPQPPITCRSTHRRHIHQPLPDAGRGLHTRLHRLPSDVNANYNSTLPFVYVDKLLLGKAVNHDISSLDELNHASDSTRSISPMSYTIIIKPHYHVGVASSLSYVIRLTSS
jgi:hypothetical protein